MLGEAAAADDVVMEEGPSSSPSAAVGSSGNMSDLAKDLEALLPPEEVEAIKASLGSLEMEQAVDELLQRWPRITTSSERQKAMRVRFERVGRDAVAQRLQRARSSC